ncbi:hypothetical protein AB4Y30_01475 [Ornithinibacillus sp. 4-3]|uniref:Uncharacterized protein n=1 Tax=Ornithinibacillus sp. 4-3 TaxID=3231488 RepID=A0AB39HNU2_9BACI
MNEKGKRMIESIEEEIKYIPSFNPMPYPDEVFITLQLPLEKIFFDVNLEGGEQ